MLVMLGVVWGCSQEDMRITTSASSEHQADWNTASLDELRQAARQGQADAMFALAVRLETGRGVERSDREAAQLYRQLVERGYVGAMINLAAMYMDGRGVPLDLSEAAHLYRRAADSGSAGAKNTLGHLYLSGRGVPQDFAIARKLFEEAVMARVPYAFASLGIMYATGSGVAQDNVEAYAWFAVGEAAGDRFAKDNRVKVESKLSTAEASRAKDRADELLRQFTKEQVRTR